MSNATTPASIDTDHVSPEDDVAAFLRANRDAILAELSSRVRIPSIAARPEHAIEVERSAHWLAGTLRKAGVTTEIDHTGAELNIRTVAGQRVSVVAEQMRAFGAEQMPTGVAYSLQVDEETGQEPYVAPEGEELAARTELGRLPSRDGGDS